eukprot:s1907_g1.t2
MPLSKFNTAPIIAHHTQFRAHLHDVEVDEVVGVGVVVDVVEGDMATVAVRYQDSTSARGWGNICPWKDRVEVSSFYGLQGEEQEETGPSHQHEQTGADLLMRSATDGDPRAAGSRSKGPEGARLSIGRQCCAKSVQLEQCSMVLVLQEKDVRTNLVMPTIDHLGRWLQRQSGFNVKNIIRHARVPIVTFETKDLEVDVSVQQPFGVLNSWHLRDLCQSGVPGRLPALVRLVKQWAKSKAIHSAKDGALSSYGWAMLAASFLQEHNLLPALLEDRPFLSADDALWYVLEAVEQRPENLWSEPQIYPVDGSSPEEAHKRPCELFFLWLQWLRSTALKPCGASAFGYLPLNQRHIVSVRGRQQEELCRAVASCPKADHWNPTSNPVFMLIEEPFTGENVARSVRENGLNDIVAELQRALDVMSTENADAAFEELLHLPPLRQRQGAPDGVGLPRLAAPRHPPPREPPPKRPKQPQWQPSHDYGWHQNGWHQNAWRDLLMVETTARGCAGTNRQRKSVMQRRIHVLAEVSGAVILSKPAEASWKMVRTFLSNQGTGLAQRFQPQRGVFPAGASGALLVKVQNSPALDDYADLYVALLRGTVPNSNVILRSRLCQPSEGSNAWRLAGLRTEGLEASTVLRPVAHGHLAGTAATLALLRPLRRASEQQLLLHCAAAGCPVLGDRQ